MLAYTKGKEISKIDLERTTQITDSKRTGSVYNEKVDSEFSIELKEYGRKLYGNDVYAGSKINIGTYTNIVLGKSLRTPFKGFLETSYIGKENVVGPDKKKTQNDILIEVSHWYGDYELPNDVTYKFKKDGTDVDKTGYVVIYFSIVSTRTRDSKSVSYLSYNMYSPDADPNQKAQWEVEGAKGNIALPTTNVNGSGPVVNTWFQGNKFEWDNGYMPVIVYDIDQTTAQNYDTTGTH